MNRFAIFKQNHADQSLRIVDLLEKDGKGLNLTFEVRDGILKHTKGKGEILCEDPEDMAFTLEGQVVRIADIIAYINHDIDDADSGRSYLSKRYTRRVSEMFGGYPFEAN